MPFRSKKKAVKSRIKPKKPILTAEAFRRRIIAEVRARKKR